MVQQQYQRIAVIGGAGYVGSALVPHLIAHGYNVKVIDLCLYGDDVFPWVVDRSKLTVVKGDIRDEAMLTRELADCDGVIHLACISNDPSFELDPELGKSINFDAFFGVLRAVRANPVSRFIYASSSSVYGVKEIPNVCEDEPCEPLTDYSKYKLMCEDVLQREGMGNADYVILRPATVCGYAPRLRLDLTVNVLTINALEKGRIRVFGGSQLRPNIHVLDVAEVYRQLLEAPKTVVDGKVFNAGYQNHSVSDIAQCVRHQLSGAVDIVTEPTNDLRSYHINSDKIARELGFRPQYTIEDAVKSLVDAHRAGHMRDPMNNPLYYNIKQMQLVSLR